MQEQTPYENFLNRVVSVLGQETLSAMNQHQETVLGETLEELLEERTYDQVTNEMIKGAWDVTTHLHPVDGTLRY